MEILYINFYMPPKKVKPQTSNIHACVFLPLSRAIKKTHHTFSVQCLITHIHIEDIYMLKKIFQWFIINNVESYLVVLCFVVAFCV